VGAGFTATITLDEDSSQHSRLIGEVDNYSVGYGLSNSYSYDDSSFTYDAMIELYLGCRPEITVDAVPVSIAPDQTAEVQVKLTCDSEPVTGRYIVLMLDGPGSIDPPAAVTDSAGVVHATYAPNGPGSVTVTAGYGSCECLEWVGDAHEVQDTATVTAGCDYQVHVTGELNTRWTFGTDPRYPHVPP
jgi:hypothetical protein